MIDTENNNVFIMINTDNIYIPNKVVNSYSYQKEALNDYIDNHITEEKQYNPSPDIKFKITKFKANILSGEYDDFFTLIRDNDTSSIISKNKDKLKKFCGYINRITCVT
jgi:hypothetical protein